MPPGAAGFVVRCCPPYIGEVSLLKTPAARLRAAPPVLRTVILIPVVSDQWCHLRGAGSVKRGHNGKSSLGPPRFPHSVLVAPTEGPPTCRHSASERACCAVCLHINDRPGSLSCLELSPSSVFHLLRSSHILISPGSLFSVGFPCFPGRAQGWKFCFQPARTREAALVVAGNLGEVGSFERWLGMIGHSYRILGVHQRPSRVDLFNRRDIPVGRGLFIVLRFRWRD